VDRVAFVESIHNQFLQAFSQALASYLDTPVNATPAGIEQAPVSVFLDAAEGDACLITLDLSPIRGRAWIGMGNGLVFRVLDILFGARPGAVPGARSALTDIERHVLRELFDIFVAALNTAWSSTGLGFRIGSGGPVQDLMPTTDPDGAAMVLKCSVRIGDSEELFRLAIPVLSVRLAVLQSEQAAGLAPVETPVLADLLEAVSAATLRLEAVLGGSTLRMSDLAAMQPGQILVLGQPAGSALDCLVNGKPKFRGEWITQGDRPAFQIDSVIEAAAPRRAQPA
jgi:flagellar motor switch protein FliM